MPSPRYHAEGTEAFRTRFPHFMLMRPRLQAMVNVFYTAAYEWAWIGDNAGGGPVSLEAQTQWAWNEALDQVAVQIVNEPAYFCVPSLDVMQMTLARNIKGSQTPGDAWVIAYQRNQNNPVRFAIEQVGVLRTYPKYIAVSGEVYRSACWRLDPWDIHLGRPHIAYESTSPPRYQGELKVSLLKCKPQPLPSESDSPWHVTVDWNVVHDMPPELRQGRGWKGFPTRFTLRQRILITDRPPEGARPPRHVTDSVLEIPEAWAISPPGLSVGGLEEHIASPSTPPQALSRAASTRREVAASRKLRDQAAAHERAMAQVGAELQSARDALVLERESREQEKESLMTQLRQQSRQAQSESLVQSLRQENSQLDAQLQSLNGECQELRKRLAAEMQRRNQEVYDLQSQLRSQPRLPEQPQPLAGSAILDQLVSERESLRQKLVEERQLRAQDARHFQAQLTQRAPPQGSSAEETQLRREHDALRKKLEAEKERRVQEVEDLERQLIAERTSMDEKVEAEKERRVQETQKLQAQIRHHVQPQTSSVGLHQLTAELKSLREQLSTEKERRLQEVQDLRSQLSRESQPRVDTTELDQLVADRELLREELAAEKERARHTVRNLEGQLRAESRLVETQKTQITRLDVEHAALLRRVEGLMSERADARGKSDEGEGDGPSSPDTAAAQHQPPPQTRPTHANPFDLNAPSFKRVQRDLERAAHAFASAMFGWAHEGGSTSGDRYNLSLRGISWSWDSERDTFMARISSGPEYFFIPWLDANLMSRCVRKDGYVLAFNPAHGEPLDLRMEQLGVIRTVPVALSLPRNRDETSPSAMWRLDASNAIVGVPTMLPQTTVRPRRRALQAIEAHFLDAHLASGPPKQNQAAVTRRGAWHAHLDFYLSLPPSGRSFVLRERALVIQAPPKLAATMPDHPPSVPIGLRL